MNPNPTLRERAIEFIFNLPQFKGVNAHARDSYMARHKDVRDMVDRLEKEFKQVYTNAIMNYSALVAIDKSPIAYSDNSQQVSHQTHNR